jgi:hypothetical protein
VLAAAFALTRCSEKLLASFAAAAAPLLLVMEGVSKLVMLLGAPA